MKKVETAIIIPKNINIVWNVLNDAWSFPYWNNQIEQIVGDIGLNNYVIVHAKVLNTIKFKFNARITDFETNKIIGWKGGIPGLVMGHHYWELKPQGEETLLIQVEQWTGICTFFINKKIIEAIKLGYENSNIRFKKYIMEN